MDFVNEMREINIAFTVFCHVKRKSNEKTTCPSAISFAKLCQFLAGGKPSTVSLLVGG